MANLASSPALLSALTAYLPPQSLLDLAFHHFVDQSEDASIRADDPQGSMTRFGEGVVFIEAVAAQYSVSLSFQLSSRETDAGKLPVSILLQESRRALAWIELSTDEKGMMNGWVKALVGHPRATESGLAADLVAVWLGRDR